MLFTFSEIVHWHYCIVQEWLPVHNGYILKSNKFSTDSYRHIQGVTAIPSSTYVANKIKLLSIDKANTVMRVQLTMLLFKFHNRLITGQSAGGRRGREGLLQAQQ